VECGGGIANSWQTDRNGIPPEAVPARVHELELALEDSRRRLQEERQQKENYEDLLTALKGDIEHHRNERDNLRDEVVPQLRARVEGLEVEATRFQRLTYDLSKLQQENQNLKNEMAEIRSGRVKTIAEEDDLSKLQQENQILKNEMAKIRSGRFNTILEEDGEATPKPKTSLSRSSSLVRGNAAAGALGRSGSLSRSGSVKERESRESLVDRVKEIELQRDALHQALKSLLDRQKYQNREHEKRVRALELERDRALEAQSPRSRGYANEVKGLRYEIDELRRRADDALEQKWQCEKGLGGLKKDLDRAEQETSSLRTLLHENDIAIPEPGSSPTVRTATDATSVSLERAYRELQKTQALSISRLRELKGLSSTVADDETTAKTMNMLIRTMSDAEAERDLAQKQAETYRAQAASLQDAKDFHEGENANLVDQLRASADRVEKLASQVRQQLEANSGLRARLAEAVGRGEREQKASAARINNMQGKLKALEDRLMAAQQHSEEAVQMHEDEVKDLEASHNLQLQRLKGTLRSPTTTLFPTSNMASKMSPRSPRSPMILGARSPMLGRTSTGIGMTMNEAMRTEYLEKRVAELEKTLKEADKEMQEVVQRMNQAQIEGLELQSAR
jgi:chromosome segregation ATPase